LEYYNQNRYQVMHIGLITSEYPHPEVKYAAGIATTIKNLALKLVEKKIRVSVFVYHQNVDKIITDQGVTIHLLKSKDYIVFGWYRYRKQLQNYINSVVKKEQIDILEAPDWTGITAFMKLQAPLVIRLHGSDAYFCKLDGRKQKAKNFWFEKNALKHAKAFIAPTRFAGEEAAKIFNLDTNKIKTIHFGLELDYFKNTRPEVFEENTILYIGTIIRKKGLFELAQIFNKVYQENPDAKLVLIGGDAPDIKTGSASTYSEVKKLFSEASLKQVNYLGRIPYSEVQGHIKNAAVCVFPSFAETFGMVTIESMSLSKAVVNTNIGWAQEQIDDGINGYLIHPTNINAYAKRITKLLGDTDQILKIGKAARIKVERAFNIDQKVDENISYYKSLIK